MIPGYDQIAFLWSLGFVYITASLAMIPCIILMPQ